MPEEISKDTMLERGEFIANGYKFTVKPIYLGEETDFLNDVPYTLYPSKKDDTELTEKDLSRYAIYLFNGSKENNNSKKKNIFSKIIDFFKKKIDKNQLYYAGNESVLGLVKWIEKKVYYKGKNIKFYDLERKYKLSKSEIVKLFGYFQDLSGF